MDSSSSDSPNHQPTYKSTNQPPTNPNLALADHFVGELAACGLDAVCIAPGSRSTPLTLAFARHPTIKHYLHLDERSAAFFALGLAMATEKPVAVVCTSGTAAAEFFPAMIEARQAGVPLLVLTTDRPHELRYSGANQTVDQVKLYGDQVLWSFDMALPEASPPTDATRSVATVAARAYAIANGLVKGPVHLNFPFRKPLEPTTTPLPPVTPKTRAAAQISQGTLQPTANQLESLAELLHHHERGLIICGPERRNPRFADAVTALATATGYPILADPLANLRYGSAAATGMILGGYETYLQRASELTTQFGGAPDLIIRFGAVPTSKWLNSYIESAPPQQLFHVRENGIWADDMHLVTDFLQVDPVSLCEQLTPQVTRGRSSWTEQWLMLEQKASAAVADYFDQTPFDAAFVAATVAAMPAGARLMIGNSLPVRHLDQYGFPHSCPFTVYGNRGASGIDGVTSTALGIAAAESAPLVLITGDITFYHDMNGLLALRQHNLRNVTIVLLNNDGGSIFRRLPVAKFDPHFTELFLTPHGLEFSHAATLYGVAHQRCDDLAAFRTAIATVIANDGPTIIEVQTDGSLDLQRQRTLTKQILDRIHHG